MSVFSLSLLNVIVHNLIRLPCTIITAIDNTLQPRKKEFGPHALSVASELKVSFILGEILFQLGQIYYPGAW